MTGHAADPYDPRAVRASTGSLFALTVVRAPSHREVLDWARARRVRVVGTDETGTVDVRDADLTGPLIVVVGNETDGMTAAWREACDPLVSDPDGRLGELAQRRHGRLDRARGGLAPAPRTA